MPFTPYHFGPSGFIGLVFGKWIDLPVFVLANVIVDIEVLVIGILDLGWPAHRYFHTLLIGAVVGAFWGVAAYPLRHFFKKMMRVFYIPYRTSLFKMIISGILGVWLHVLIDGIYHSDVRIFWPHKTTWLRQMIKQYITKEQIETICMLFFIAAFVVYILAVTVFRRNWVRDNE
jgi:membrane-bound metal-dependent hydrolase YbcI (DUF457 family)